jgi:hypothetical protein
LGGKIKIYFFHHLHNFSISGEYISPNIQINTLSELKEIQNELIEYGPSKSFIGMEQLISNQIDI